MMRTKARKPLLVRALPYFLLWLATRAAYFLYFASADTSYRMAAEAGFGPARWTAEALFAFLATGAAVTLWWRWRHAVTLTLAAMALYTSVAAFQLYLVEQDPQRARVAYIASRETRGLPVRAERVDQMFSPSGRVLAWLVAAFLCFGPVAVVLRHRAEFEPEPAD